MQCAKAQAFDYAIGIDWSGAYSSQLPGLKVAVAEFHHKDIRLQPPLMRYWRRRDVFTLLQQLIGSGARIAVGIDFGFAFPYQDRGEYFSYLPLSDPPAIWQWVDDICSATPGFYAGEACQPSSPLQPYLLTNRGGRGAHFAMRWRVTEQLATSLHKARPSSVAKGIGPDSVAVGSLAGMRLLHALTQQFPDAVGVWPIHADATTKQCCVFEIFPRLYYQCAGYRGQAWRQPDNFMAACAYYASMPQQLPGDEHEGDALISAAAIRWLLRHDRPWQPVHFDAAAARREGWIFGVGCDIAA